MGFLDRLRPRDGADDDVEFSPPAEREVSCRALCLAAHAALGSAVYGLSAGNAPPDAVHRFARDLHDWLQGEGLELWHWRARTSSLQADEEFVRANPQWDLDQVVRETARRAAEVGDIPSAIDDDFPAFGKAYRNLSEDEYEQATSIAMERHLALNWLCGYDSDWDETPTDT